MKVQPATNNKLAADGPILVSLCLLFPLSLFFFTYVFPVAVAFLSGSYDVALCQLLPCS